MSRFAASERADGKPLWRRRNRDDTSTGPDASALSLAAAGLLAAAPAFPSGFQIMTQGARATGMGLAFTAVADDPSAIFYNPAGIGFQDHFSVELGAGFITKLDGGFRRRRTRSPASARTVSSTRRRS